MEKLEDNLHNDTMGRRKKSSHKDTKTIGEKRKINRLMTQGKERRGGREEDKSLMENIIRTDLYTGALSLCSRVRLLFLCLRVIFYSSSFFSSSFLLIPVSSCGTYFHLFSMVFVPSCLCVPSSFLIRFPSALIRVIRGPSSHKKKPSDRLTLPDGYFVVLKFFSSSFLLIPVSSCGTYFHLFSMVFVPSCLCVRSSYFLCAFV